MMTEDPRIAALPDIHGHAKGEHKPFAEERPIPYTARMLFLWFFHACRRGAPRFMMVADHVNYLTFEDPAATNLVRRALKLAEAGDLYGAAETAGVELHHAAVVSEGLRRGMRCSIGAEVDNDPRNRPDAQNIVDAMRPDGMIRAVHFLPITHPQHGENWMWAFGIEEFKELFDVIGVEATWEQYVTTLLDAIEKLPGHIVAHFYAPAKFGHWPDDAKLEEYEDRLVAACAERGLAIEVNTRPFYRYFADDETQRDKYRAVTLRLLRKAKAKGVAVAVGSGAHSPKDQGGAFETVLALLDEAEINEIAFPIGGRLAHVALRATEEHVRQVSGYAVEPPVLEPSEVAPAAVQSEESGSSEVPADGVAQRPRPRRAARAVRKSAAPATAGAGDPELPAVSATAPDATPPPAKVGPLDGGAASAARAAVAPRRRTRPQSPRPPTAPTTPAASVRNAAKSTPKKAAARARAAQPKPARAKPAAGKATTAKRTKPIRKSAAPKRRSSPRLAPSSVKKTASAKKAATRSGSRPARKTSVSKTAAKRSPAPKSRKAAKAPAPLRRSAASKKTAAKKGTAKKKSSRARR